LPRAPRIWYKGQWMCGFWTMSRRFGASDRAANQQGRMIIRPYRGPYAVYPVMHVLRGEMGGIHTYPASTLFVPSWLDTSPFRKGGGSARILPRGAILTPPRPVGPPCGRPCAWGWVPVNTATTQVGRFNQKEDQQC
jgi:hypothetical protein